MGADPTIPRYFSDPKIHIYKVLKIPEVFLDSDEENDQNTENNSNEDLTHKIDERCFDDAPVLSAGNSGELIINEPEEENETAIVEEPEEMQQVMNDPAARQELFRHFGQQKAVLLDEIPSAANITNSSELLEELEKPRERENLKWHKGVALKYTARKRGRGRPRKESKEPENVPVQRKVKTESVPVDEGSKRKPGRPAKEFPLRRKGSGDSKDSKKAEQEVLDQNLTEDEEDQGSPPKRQRTESSGSATEKVPTMVPTATQKSTSTYSRPGPRCSKLTSKAHNPNLKANAEEKSSDLETKGTNLETKDKILEPISSDSESEYMSLESISSDSRKMTSESENLKHEQSNLKSPPHEGNLEQKSSSVEDNLEPISTSPISSISNSKCENSPTKEPQSKASDRKTSISDSKSSSDKKSSKKLSLDHKSSLSSSGHKSSGSKRLSTESRGRSKSSSIKLKSSSSEAHGSNAKAHNESPSTSKSHRDPVEFKKTRTESSSSKASSSKPQTPASSGKIRFPRSNSSSSSSSDGANEKPRKSSLFGTDVQKPTAESPKTGLSNKYPLLYMSLGDEQPSTATPSPTSPHTALLLAQKAVRPPMQRRKSVFEQQKEIVNDNMPVDERETRLRHWNQRETMLLSELPPTNPQIRRKGRPSMNEEGKFRKQVLEQRKIVQKRRQSMIDERK